MWNTSSRGSKEYGMYDQVYDLLETVLSMDDFGSFKAQMLRLKRDLELLHLPDGTLNEFAPQARR